MRSFSIKEIPEFSKKERIVVIGFIGKSPLQCANKATTLLEHIDCDEPGIQCFWDERKSILYLHAVTKMDSTVLMDFISKMDKEPKSEDEMDSSDWLVAAGDITIDSSRIFGLIFNLCHIVVLSSPTSAFDHGYLQIFKALDNHRLEVNPQIIEALSAADMGGNWETHGRACCPRLLFHFNKAPPSIKRRPNELKKLEHCIEDDIYYMLRKARIITNVCAKSLFAIPKNEEFVYITADSEQYNARDLDNLVQGLVRLCEGKPLGSMNPDRATFRQFLNGHVQTAFEQGFDDNVGKYAMSTSFFELPSAASWRAAAQIIAPIYLNSSDIDEGGHRALNDALATDLRFSEARCAKVLPIAQAAYNKGLPSHYSSQHHEHKLVMACSVLERMARGPAWSAARASLRESCAQAWRSRRLCEARSLTGNPCVEAEHDNTKDHSSGVRYIGACNCGRARAARDDPYTVKQANFTFYELAAKHCGLCTTLTSVAFPVFQPSTSSFKAAAVKSQPCQEEGEEARAETQESPPEGAWSGSPEALSPGEDDDEDEHTPKTGTSPKKFDVVAVREDSLQEKHISRQPSTTEYLPGMLHIGSPSALLPAYPSWSMLCLGPSSLYSHSLGLPEHLQPGFLPHTNFLLPWDCAVKMEQANPWRPTRGRGKSSASHHLTVKIFIGYEYECPRGHRFMMSTPEKAVCGGSAAAAAGGTSGLTAAAGGLLAKTEMPVKTHCVCRGAKCNTAHLRRLHIVTPKAPALVTLHPKVQPVSGGPVFIPQPESDPPIKLSASTYWVLRFPYIYADERGPLPISGYSGSVQMPMFGIAD